MKGLVWFVYAWILLFVSEARRVSQNRWKTMLPDVLLQEDNPYSLDSVETTTYDSYVSGESQEASNNTQSSSDNSTDSDEQASKKTSYKNSIEVEDEEYEDYDDILHAYYSGEVYEDMVGVTDDSDNEQTELPRAYSDSDNSTDSETRVVDREGDASESKGDEPRDGDLQFVLVTSYVDGYEGTGKVWAIPKDSPDNAQAIIAGLQKPTGICFDINNDLLYIADPGFENDGFIYQYEILWDEDEKFVLSSDDYVVIIEGSAPYDCSVDEYGNLFYVDYIDNEINVVEFSDLWAGTKNQEYAIYARTEDTIPISYPVAIDVVKSEDLWYVNNLNCDTYGLLDYAKANTEYLNGETIESKVHSKYRGWGVTVGKANLAHFSMSSGEVYAYNIESDEDTYLKSKNFFDDPRGLCYGDGLVYVADFERGVVYKMHDNDEEEEPEGYVRIEGAYNLFCVNSSAHLMLSLVLLLVLTL